MKTEFFHEPELEFGTGRHIDIKFGLMNYGPFDFDNHLAPKKIKLGIIGTPETIEGIVTWLEKSRTGIPAKPSKRPNLFPRFPGFGEEMPLCADFVLDSQLQRAISPNYFDELCQRPKTGEVIQKIAQLYLDEIEYLTEKTTVDVFVCAFPFVLAQFLEQDEDEVDDDIGDYHETLEPVATSPKFILHDLLKAQAMRFRKPTQIIRPSTYDESKRLKSKTKSGNKRSLQDEATRVWNLYTALYYKAGGTPWRLIRNASELSACYIGVSFYKTLDEASLLTSTAQVFNERGEGVVLRGGTAQISKNDKQIHLSAENAYNLLKNALQIYQKEHRNFPARVVIHKSSKHSIDEITGFEEALRGSSIEPELTDFVSVTGSDTKLFRGNRYPPLRGTFWDTGGESFVLYTRGSVDFFSTYPGLYVPMPLGFRCDRVAQTPTSLAQEILALTKMNWNNTQFDGGQPITIRCARQVGQILKYFGPNDHYEPYYRFYM
ncbi:MAG: hypothetical protein OXU36_09925 [Candidatus Poribacteria bacterium]|nr:hypothetical protein [Candidatus Poribacteria bacterium]